MTHMDRHVWTQVLNRLLKTTVAIRRRMFYQIHLILVFRNHLTFLIHFNQNHQPKLVNRLHLVFCLALQVLFIIIFSQLVLALLHAKETRKHYERFLASGTESHISEFSLIFHSISFQPLSLLITKISKNSPTHSKQVI